MALHLRGLGALMLALQASETSIDDLSRHDGAFCWLVAGIVNTLAGAVETGEPPTIDATAQYRVTLAPPAREGA